MLCPRYLLLVTTASFALLSLAGCLRPSSPIEQDEFFDTVDESSPDSVKSQSKTRHPVVVKRRQVKFGVPPPPNDTPTPSPTVTATPEYAPTAVPTPTPAPTPVSKWYQEAYIKASNSDKDDFFGYSVSLSGELLAVGAYQEDSSQTTITNASSASDNNTASDSGAVYVFRRTGSAWEQESYIKAGNSRYLDKFGFSVSLSADTLAVGAPEEDSDQNTITNGTDSSPSDQLTHSGAVYVYRRDNSQWTQEAYIKAANVGWHDFFGTRVSLSGNTLAVAAESEDNSQNTISNGTAVSDAGVNENSGAVYVYHRTGTQWSQQAYLKNANLDGHDHFGTSVSLVGDTLAVGAYGEDSSQNTITNGSGASGDNASPDAGAVYVYRRYGNQWMQEAYVKASNTTAYDNFGANVSLSSNGLTVGVPSEDSSQATITNGPGSSVNDSLTNAGAVYIYRRDGVTWSQEAYLKAANAGRHDDFGRGLAFAGDSLAVGAPQEDSNQTTITNAPTANAEDILGDAGAVYVYLRQNDTWVQEAYLKAANADGYVHSGQEGDLFGYSISLSGDTLAVGAHRESSAQTTITNGTAASNDNSKFHSGSVYVYRNTGRMFEPEVHVTGSTSSQVSFAWSNNLGTAQQIKVAVAVTGTAEAAKHCEGGTVLPPSESTYTYTKLNALTKYGFRFCAWDGSKASEGVMIWYDTLGWYQEAFVKASNAGSGDRFGSSISLQGNTLVVGAPEEDSSQTTITHGTAINPNNSNKDSGAVYVFRRDGTHWAQEAYIKAVNGDSNDNFGTAVSVSGDTLVVGATGEGSVQNTITNGDTASSNNAEPYAGAVYVYRRNGSEWMQEAYVKADNVQGYIPSNYPVTWGKSADYFGRRVSLSGDTFAVGVPAEDSSQSFITNGTSANANNSNSDSGAVYVYRRVGTDWAQEAFIKASNVGYSDKFGTSVELSGDLLAVGANDEDSNQTTITNGATASGNNGSSESGAVYIFRRNANQWEQEAYIKASNNNVYDRFGSSVSVSGDLLVVGAPEEDSDQTTITNGTTASEENILGDSGAVYVYRRSNTGWSQEAYVKAANAGGYINSTKTGDRFGWSVSVSGDTLAVGAHHEDSNQTTITNSGVASDDDSWKKSGAVYIYRRIETQWTQEAYVKASNARSDANFGSSVELSGDTLAVAAHNDDTQQNTITNGPGTSSASYLYNSGAVYLYRNAGRMFDPDVYVSDFTSSSVSFRWTNTLGSAFAVKVAKSTSTNEIPNAHCDGGVVLDAGTTSFTDSDLNSNTSYSFRFCAWDGQTASHGAVIFASTN